MSVLGCAPASLHPTYDYSIQDSQADCRAPSCGSKHRAAPAAGARKDKLRPVTAPSAMRSLRDPLPMSNMLSGPEQYGKGSWQSAFPDQLSRERFEEKNYRQIPQGMLRYATPPSCGSKHRAASTAGARKDKLRPVTCSALPGTRCAVAAKPFANEQYAFRPRAVWQRVVAVCLSILFSRGLHTLTRKLHKRQIATLFCRGLRRPTFTLFGKTARKNKNADCTAVLLGNPFAGVLKSEKSSEKQKFYGQ